MFREDGRTEETPGSDMQSVDKQSLPTPHPNQILEKVEKILEAGTTDREITIHAPPTNRRSKTANWQNAPRNRQNVRAVRPFRERFSSTQLFSARATDVIPLPTHPALFASRNISSLSRPQPEISRPPPDRQVDGVVPPLGPETAQSLAFAGILEMRPCTSWSCLSPRRCTCSGSCSRSG